MNLEETKKYLKDHASLLDGAVHSFLDNEKKYADTVSPVAHEVLTFAESACIGGKRLRGTFVITAARMLGNDEVEDTLKIATIIELIHSAILIFDDVIDDSPLRHNHTTVHYQYFHAHKNRPGAFLFGQGVALSIAMVLEHVVFEAINNTKLPDATKIKLYSYLHRSFANTAYGELLDVYSFVYDNPPEEHILKVLDYKTAKYTYEMPLHTGAILANATQIDMNTIKQYSQHAGIAFQIIDDILGVFGEEESVGKSILSDIMEGKKTLLVNHLLSKGTAAQRELLQKGLGNKELNYDLFADIKQAFIDAGSKDYASQKARELMEKSNTVLRNPPKSWGKEQVEFLLGLNEYVLTRDR